MTAQLILPPKVLKAKPVDEKLQQEQGLASGLIAKGWHGEFGIGLAIWGIESQCSCNALAADLGFYYIHANGLSIGTQLLQTNTISKSLSPSFKIGYQHIKKIDRSLGAWSASLLAGSSIRYSEANGFRDLEDYSGFIYGGEISFQPRLGRSSLLRGVMSVGWLTQRETYLTGGWRGQTETKMTHSGVRIRFGFSI